MLTPITQAHSPLTRPKCPGSYTYDASPYHYDVFDFTPTKQALRHPIREQFEPLASPTYTYNETQNALAQRGETKSGSPTLFLSPGADIGWLFGVELSYGVAINLGLGDSEFDIGVFSSYGEANIQEGDDTLEVAATLGVDLVGGFSIGNVRDMEGYYSSATAGLFMVDVGSSTPTNGSGKFNNHLDPGAMYYGGYSLSPLPGSFISAGGYTNVLSVRGAIDTVKGWFE